jgi:hypothetical protein
MAFSDNSFLVYDASTNVTRTLALMPVVPESTVGQNGTRNTTRSSAYGMTLLGNDVLVCGGEDRYYVDLSSCALYKASINKWAATSPLPVAMSRFPMITLHTRPYVFGGLTGGFRSVKQSISVLPIYFRTTVNTVYTFGTSNAWAARTPMEQAVYGHTAVALDTNTALVCGGSQRLGGSAVQSCFSYAATENVWSPAVQMNTARMGHGMAVYKGLLATMILHTSCCFLV